MNHSFVHTYSFLSNIPEEDDAGLQIAEEIEA